MKVLSLGQFQSLCQGLDTPEYIFDTRNQPDNDNSDARISERYSEMAIMYSPGRICLKNDYGMICFDRVKSIIHNEDPEDVCLSFDITCGNIKDTTEDTSYTILVRKYHSK